MAARNPYYSGPKSDHFDGVRFFNPGGVEPGSFRDLLRWQFNGQRSKWPKAVESPFAGHKPEPRVEKDGSGSPWSGMPPC